MQLLGAATAAPRRCVVCEAGVQVNDGSVRWTEVAWRIITTAREPSDRIEVMRSAQLRRRLGELHAYVRLQAELEPGQGGARNPEIRRVLNAAGEFLQSGSDDDLRTRGPALEGLLAKMCGIHPHLKPKKEPDEIGRDFLLLGKAYDVWRYGVQYGWLLERFNQPILALPPDLPAHARIGLGHSRDLSR
jgi:hypothetical protein